MGVACIGVGQQFVEQLVQLFGVGVDLRQASPAS